MKAETSTKRVLVVDDDPVLCALEQRGLAGAGHEAVTAINGSDALARLQAETFDLVIVDLMMPVMGGLDLLRWLRQEHESDVPAIVFTSHDSDEVIEKAREAGATRVLRKPINLKLFLATVEELLSA